MSMAETSCPSLNDSNPYTTMLSILNIIEDTMVDGPGFRTAIYCAGCPNACPGCHNPQSWDIRNGHPMGVEELMEVIMADSFADVTFTGGDPMYQAEDFTELAKAIRRASKKTIWCYTGFTPGSPWTFPRLPASASLWTPMRKTKRMTSTPSCTTC